MFSLLFLIDFKMFCMFVNVTGNASLCISFGAYRIRLCLVIYRTLGSSMFLLLFFEPFSIAFETMQVRSLKHLFSSLAMNDSVYYICIL